MGVPAPAPSVVRQLHDWARARGLTLFPRVVPFDRFVRGDVNAAISTVVPDLGMVVVSIDHIDGMPLAATDVIVDNIQTGSRRLISGTLRVASLVDGMETDGLARYFCAPIFVAPSAALTVEVRCADTGDTFGDGAPLAATRFAAVGYTLHDEATGTALTQIDAANAIDDARQAIGELRVLGLSGFGDAIVDRTSPQEAMSVEVLPLKRIRGSSNRTASLRFGPHDVLPYGAAAVDGTQTAAAWTPCLRAPGLRLVPKTPIELRTTSTSSENASVAIHGRVLP